MKTKRPSTLLFAGAVLALCAAYVRAAWVQVYYTGWQQDLMPPAAVDFGAMTQLVHFSVIPNDDGTLDRRTNGLTAARVHDAVSAAHAAGKKILFSIGGYPSRERFESAMSAPNEARFIESIAAFLSSNRYDGVDLDMEPMSPSDAPLFTKFAADLRAKLDTMAPRPLLTTTALWTPEIFARVAGLVDEINVMTYGLSGPYRGWMTWHNAAVYDKGYRFPGGGIPPSADALVRQFEDAGVPKSKLGIGFSMAPYVWTGVSRPGQAWTGAPPTAKETSYSAVADAYGLTEDGAPSKYYHWDENAQAPYLSVEDAAPARFVSYDDAASARAKADYVRLQGLGGLAVWDLQDGYRAKQPAGRREPLMDAIKAAFLDNDPQVIVLPTPTVPIRPLPRAAAARAP